MTPGDDPRPRQARCLGALTAIGRKITERIKERSARRVLGTAGIAAIEFALATPVLILVMVGIVDIGFAIHNRIGLSQVMSAGAQYAYNQGQSESGSTLTTDVQTFIQAVTPVTLSTLSVTYNNGLSASSCYCVNGSPPVYTGPVGCGATCSDGSGSTAGKYLTISGAVTFTPFFVSDTAWAAPLSSSVTVRLQ